jgi:diguanylate cyclase (GGDEF)-like protein
MSVHRGGRLDDEGLARLLAAMEAHLFVAEIDPVQGYRDVYTGPGEDRLLGGLPPDGEEPGEAWSARVDPRDEPRYREAMVLAQSGRPAEVEYRLLGYDGMTRWVQERCRPWHDHEGRLMLDGLVVDVTPWRLEQERLQEQLRAALAAMTDAHQEAELRSRTDSLTGVFNRRHFHEVLAAELARAERDGSTPGVLMVDIDHFKRINDELSHDVGDLVLVRVAKMLEARVTAARPDGFAARMGGEEFLLVLPDKPVPEAARLLDRIRHEVRTHGWDEITVGLPVTVSIGLAGVGDAPARTQAGLLSAADRNLYAAKRGGRDRVVSDAMYGDRADVRAEPYHADLRAEPDHADERAVHEWEHERGDQRRRT